jgi:hypothetical protein
LVGFQAERKPDSKKRYGKITPDRVEIAERCATAHVVFGMNFEPSNIRAVIDKGLMMLKPQPDPGLRGDWPAATDCRRDHWILGVRSR